MAQYPGIDRATHFYSDDDFAHEIYAGRPQRVIFLEDWSSQEFLQRMMAKGTCPFLLISRWSGVVKPVDQLYSAIGLQRSELVGGDFVVYAQECLLQP